MFKRVNLESWHDLVPYICFALIAGAFVVILVRVCLMKKSEADRLARLPLEEKDRPAGENERDSDPDPDATTDSMTDSEAKSDTSS